MSLSDRADRFTVVEIGCGTGEHIAHGSRTGPALGVDIDLGVLRVASSEGSSGTAWICADGARLPLRDASVSTVTLQAVLHHLPDTDAALQEFARVLNSGGTMRIVDGVALPEAVAQALDVELTTAGLPSEPVYGFDLEELSRATTKAGFRVESTHLEGTATYATPPVVSQPYTSDRFVLVATTA